MGFFWQILNFYLRGSIHVALSVFALILMTQHMFGIPYDKPVALFGFFGTITGYNFVKYDELARIGRKKITPEIRRYAALSFISFLAAVACFFQFRLVTQVVSLAVLALTALYTLPFFPNRRNARNWSGVKIYIVALCWVGVTVVLPLIDAGISFSNDFFIKCLQRFILIFVLILIFEIIDLAIDDPHLQTVPQQIGIERTKLLGYALMFSFLGLEFMLKNPNFTQLGINAVLFLLVVGFLRFAHPGRSRYYSAFWVESIPVVWFILVLYFSQFRQDYFPPLF